MRLNLAALVVVFGDRGPRGLERLRERLITFFGRHALVAHVAHNAAV